MEHPHSSLQGKTIAVVGGGAGWGAKIARTSRNLADRVLIIEQETNNDVRDEILRSADVVFLAAPDTEIAGILNETRALLDGKAVLDCATNKSEFFSMLQELSSDASVCSTHPMVRSETPSRGQTVLVMPVGERSGDATGIAEDIFSSLGMRRHRFRLDDHPEAMTVVQYAPHLMQRIHIAVLARVLETLGMTLDDVHEIAPANFTITEFGIGRVAIQRPGVSAKIIERMGRSDFGKRINAIISSALEQMTSLQGDDLEEKISQDILRLDVSGDWRRSMEILTDVQLEAKANFYACSFQLEIDQDSPGLLGKVASVVSGLGLNMNAVHSHTIEREDGRGVRFDIGIDNSGSVPWKKLEREFRRRGWLFSRMQQG